MPEEPSTDQRLEGVVHALWSDYFADALRPLAHYVAGQPALEAEIAAEYRLVRRVGGSNPALGGRNGEGDRIGPYRILREIGRGAQASVYLTEDTVLGRPVALKVLASGLAQNASAIRRFRREAEITSKLDHPGICPVYATGEDRGAFWIAMRYVEGTPLSKKAWSSAGDANPPATREEIDRVVAFFEQAARTLDVAHEHGVIHRDIKPGNVIVDQGGNPVILDFGLAEDLASDQPSLTLTGSSLGTPAYMSPEQIATTAVVLDRRTDLYSLGVSLYECLTGKRAFEAPTREGLYRAIATQAPRSVRELNAAIPPDLGLVVHTAIEKERDRRYQTALSLAEDLRRVRAREPILAKPVGNLVRLRRWSQRNPALAAASCALVLAFLASLALLVQVTRERSRTAEALADYDRLGDLSRLRALVSEVDSLWPSAPSKVPAMRNWLAEADDLERRLPDHARVLARLRLSAIATGAAAADSRASSRPEAWRFASAAEQFKHDTTAQLVAELETFAGPDPVDGLLPAVRRRMAFAESMERDTVTSRAPEWADAIRSIADRAACPKYDGLRIEPQPGLIPIGRDPASGLWEFVHLETAEPGSDPVPARDAKGRLVVADGTGLVFVLLPGGTFRMGAVLPDDDQLPTEPNVDRGARADESPVTEIRLFPFFMSKYEMTQGQWLRTTGRNPSQWFAGKYETSGPLTLRNPVERLGWNDCSLWIGRLGLVLPTEAQWEYAARGGAGTPWWTGIDSASLEGAANLADEYCRTNRGDPTWDYESWSDGYTLHAPVGSFAPNPFGLHDVHGNVSEWCRDHFTNYRLTPAPGDGLRGPPGAREKLFRGGGYASNGVLARVAGRFGLLADLISPYVGVRPARPLRP